MVQHKLKEEEGRKHESTSSIEFLYKCALGGPFGDPQSLLQLSTQRKRVLDIQSLSAKLERTETTPRGS